MSSIVTPSTYNTAGVVPTLPTVGGLPSVSSSIDPVVAATNAANSASSPPNGVQSDEFGVGLNNPYQQQLHPQQQFNNHGFPRAPLPYYPFQLRQNQQQYHQQLPPLPVFVNGLPNQFQSPFSSHQQPAFGYNQQAPLYHPQQQQNYQQFQGINPQLNNPFLVNQHQQQQQFNSNPFQQQQQQQQQSNHLSDELSPSDIATQITNQVSNQVPSQTPSTFFEQIGQFGQNVGQTFNEFGQNIGQGFNNAWQQVNQFGQNVGSTFGNFFGGQGNGRVYGVVPLGFRTGRGFNAKAKEGGDWEDQPKRGNDGQRGDVQEKGVDEPIEYHH